MTTTYIDPTAGFHTFALQSRTDPDGYDVDDVAGEDLRAILGMFTEGIVTPGDAYIVAPDSGMDITVGSGTAFTDLAVVAGEDPGQGNYLTRLGDAETGITIEAADLSNPRIDQIWLAVLDDTYDSTGLVLATLAVTKGTPGASPSPPGADGSWKASHELARITVGAGVTTIGAGDIEDRRELARLDMVGAGSVPPGSILDFAAETAPDGWLFCDGSAISRTTYAALFAAIGTVFGVGDGSTTFDLPNLQGKLRIGRGGTPALAVGDTDGSWDHTHTGPSHTHDPGTLAVPAHSSHTHARGTLAVPDHAQHRHSITHTHSFSDGFTTGSPSSTTVVSQASSDIGVGSGTHTHSGSVSGTTGGASTGYSGYKGAMAHGTITGSTATDGPTTHGAITGATNTGGTGATGSANPPVMALKPIIKT